MGGKNPLVVLDDADIPTRCGRQSTAPISRRDSAARTSRIIVTAGIHDRFVDALVARLKRLVIDDALKPGTEIGPVVDERQLRKSLEYVQIGLDEGAAARFGGRGSTRNAEGYYLEPALFVESAPTCGSIARKSSGRLPR